MASKRDRQRKLERARIERRIARQANRQRRKRQIQAGTGAGLAIVVIALGATWALGGFTSEPKPKQTVAAGTCTWYLKDADAAKNIADTGHPPTSGERREGTINASLTTNQGSITVELDRGKAPCTTASFEYLAGKKYFDKTQCHRLTTDGIYVLQCGDPSGTGSGGPAYSFANEFVPTAAMPSTSPSATSTASATPSAPSAGTTVTYAKGTVAMAHSSEPDSNGSQFFLVYRDSPLPADYTVFGKIVTGLDVIEKIAKGGVTPGSDGKKSTDGKPATSTTIESATVGEAAPAASTTASAGTTPSANATKSEGAAQ